MHALTCADAQGGWTVPAIHREPWAKYVARVTHGLTPKQVAEQVGLHVSTIRRWLNGEENGTVESVIAFARGLGERPAEALVHRGFLEPEELDGAFQVVRAPSELSDKELLAELTERLAERPSRGEVDDYSARFTTPDDGLEGREDQTGLT